MSRTRNKGAVSSKSNTTAAQVRAATGQASTRSVALLAAALAAGIPAGAMANPVLDHVAHGNVSLDTSGKTLNVNQTSQKAIINWSDFSIGADETTRFVQPGADSIALNRVTGGNVSEILGRLTANGQIMLINPNGILFGAGSQVDVQGLIATTANISDENFVAGNYHFNTPGNADAQIVNQGNITVADSGIAALVAPNVRNSGVIYGRMAKISLAGGESFTVDLYGDGLVQLEVARAENTHSKVTNEGTVNADGGTVLLTTQQAAGVVEGVVNMGTITQATSAQIIGGKIILNGGSHGTVNVDGTVRGVKTDNNGGEIDIYGRNINVASGAHINADATTVGNGGAVTVKALKHLDHQGQTTARGGATSGNGGTIELSGQTFVLAGTVKASAVSGQAGTVTIDPNDIIIADGDTPGAPAMNTVYEKWIEGLSQGGTNVVLTAKKSITMNNLFDDKLTGGAGNIYLLADQDGSTLGAIVFNDKNDEIRTTTGSIYLRAGLGGIDVGSLRTGGIGVNNPGSITLETIRNGGNISARDLRVLGSGTGSINVQSRGDVTLRNATLDIVSNGADATATNTIYGRGDVTVEETAGVQAIANVEESLGAKANAKLDVTGRNSASIRRIRVNSYATTNGKFAGNVEANATANVLAPKVTVSEDVKVHAEAIGNGVIPVEVVVEYLSHAAGYSNAVGYYEMDEHGNPTIGKVGFSSTHHTPRGSTFTFLAKDLASIGFFLIPNSGYKNHISDNTPVTFKQIGKQGKWAAFAGDTLLQGFYQPALFSNPDLNPDDNYVHLKDTDTEGNHNWEDWSKEVSDDDYDDANMNVWSVEHDKFDATATATLNIHGKDSVDLQGNVTVDSVAEVTGDAYKTVTANTDVDIVSSKGTVNSAGKITTIAYAGAIDDNSDNPPVVSAENDTYIFGRQGVTVNDLAASSVAVGDTKEANDVTAKTHAEIYSTQGDITANGYLKSTSDVYGSGDADVAESTISSDAALVVKAGNGDIVLNDKAIADANTSVEGNGYKAANSTSLASFFAGESFTNNEEVRSRADVNHTEEHTGDVKSRADISIKAKGETGRGDVNINGKLRAEAKAMEDDAVAEALVRVEAADDIVFGAGVEDPHAQTHIRNGQDAFVQGRVSMKDVEGDDFAQLILKDKLDPEEETPPGGNPPGGNPPGGNPPGGNPPGGNPPGGNPPGGNPPGGNPPGDGIDVEANLNQIFIDPLDRFLMSLRDAGLVNFLNQRPYFVSLETIDLSLLGSGGNVTAAASNLSPEALGALAPAAGGIGGASDIQCANSFLDEEWSKAPEQRCTAPEEGVL